MIAVKQKRKVVLNSIAKSVRSLPAVELAYVYGSFLKSSEYGDVDVGVFLSKRARRDLWNLRQELAARIEQALPRTCRKDVDLHILQEMPLVLQHRIISEGCCVFARQELSRVHYEEWVLNSFLDFQPTYQWFNRQAVERWRRPSHAKP